MTRARIAGLIALGCAAALLAAASLAWERVTDRMAGAVDAWRRAEVAAGAVVDTGPATRGGWPFEAVLELPGVTLATDAPGQGDALAWRAERVRLLFAPWRPGTVDVLVDGAQSVQFGAAPPVPLSLVRLDATVPLDGAGQAQGVAVAVRGLSVPLPGGPVRFDDVSVQLRQSDAFVAASGVTLPGRSLPFGGTVQSVAFHACATGPLPPLRDPAAALRAWRDGGQRLRLDDLLLRWGPLDVSGHASLGLDGELQPEGTASVTLTGFAEVIEALASAGAITRSDAQVATTLLGLVARPGSGDVAEAELPLTLRARTLSVGAIPLLRMPVLAVP